jgi:hypothetical protein
MRVSSFAVARPAYYDRNASSLSAQYSGVVAPHGGTVRFTVTVAAGKKLFLESGHVYISRQTAATVVGNFDVVIYVNTGGNNPRYLYVASKDNTVQPAPTFATITGTTTLYTGEVLESQTADGSTGGLVQFISMYKATSFDA